MIILDNIIYNLQQGGGISVVWYELVRRLLDHYGCNIEFIDNCCNDNNYRKQLNIKNVLKDDFFIPMSRFLPVRIKRDSPFLFHSSYYRYCSSSNAINITTVHDFTYDYYRKGLAKWIHCWQRNRAIRHSDYIVCISENTKRDLLRFLPDVDKRKIRIIYNGVSEDYFVLNGNNNAYELPFPKDSYLVFVGGRSGYKNFDLLKKVISKTKYNLIIVGSKLNKKEEEDLQIYISKDRYVSTGFLPNEQLNVIYNNAAALVYPSAYEGFGIPVIEAQRAGCPVIAYNGSSIPEIIGETPLLIDRLAEEELLSKIELLSDSQLMAAIRNTGLKNSIRFSWDKMYQEYQKLYETIMENIP